MRAKTLAVALGCVAWTLGCGGGESAEPNSDSVPAEPTTEFQSAGTPAESIALFQAAEHDRLRGRVIYRQTAQPWTAVWVRFATEEGECRTLATDTGHFVAPRALPGGEVRVFVGIDEDGPWVNPEGELIEHLAETASETVHVLRTSGGPSYALDFLDHASEEPTRWEARLIERGPAGRIRAWSWQVLRPGDPPRLRYLRPEEEPEDDWSAFVEVRLRDKDWFARGPVESTVGERLEPLALELVQYASFGGTLVDEAGHAIVGAQLSLVQVSGSETPLFDAAPRLTRSDEEGGFLFPLELEPGHYHLGVQAEGRPEKQLDVDIEGGHSDGYRLVLEALEATEQLAVAVVGAEEGTEPIVLISLKSEASPNDEPGSQGIWRCLHTRMRTPERGLVQSIGMGYAMLFEELPPGRYVVSLFPMDGQRYEPAEAVIELPVREGAEDGVVFLQVEPTSLRDLRFVVRGRGEEAELDSYDMRFSAPGWWYPQPIRVTGGYGLGEVSLDSFTQDWTLWAPGFRPAHGHMRDLGEGEGEAVVEVELDAGWGFDLVVLDGSRGLPREDFDTWQNVAFVHQATRLEGVLVIADGRLVGQSDGQGRVRVALDERPNNLELFKDGWRVVRGLARGRAVAKDLDRLEFQRTAAIWLLPVN